MLTLLGVKSVLTASPLASARHPCVVSPDGSVQDSIKKWYAGYTVPEVA